MSKRFVIPLLAIFLLLSLCATAAIPQASPGETQAPAARATPARTASTPPAAPSASEIAAAKASHQVWVNLDSGIYHKGGRWYGKTRNGRFMTVDDARKAGFKPAKRD